MTIRCPADDREVQEDLTQYLSRLGLAASPAPTVAGLAELQRRHLDAVPYENLTGC